MEELVPIINNYYFDTTILEEQNENIIELLTRCIELFTRGNEIKQFIANQFYFYLIALSVLIVTYMLYRVVKNFY